MVELGEHFDPPNGVAWSDGNSPTDPPRGYYPLNEDGQTYDSSIRLRWIDDAPDDPMDGTGHFERMHATTGYFHGRRDVPRPEQTEALFKQIVGIEEPEVVPLQAEVEGKADVGEGFFKNLFGGKK